MKEFFEYRTLKGFINIALTRGGRWEAEKAIVAGQIIGIIERFSKQGYTLTLRQLYYQLVAADYIPNDDKVYKKLGRILDDLRYSGLIDWHSIEDRGRVPKLPYYVNGMKDAVEDAVSTYRLDRQQGQPYHIEVWTEKEAVSNILYRVTRRYQIRLVVNKGYSSSTAMHRAYSRFIRHINDGRKVLVLYLGDHDPSGLDMVRDIRERITHFICAGQLLRDSLVSNWYHENRLDVYDIANFSEKYEDVDRLLDHDVSEVKKDALSYVFEQGMREMYLYNNGLFEVKAIGLTADQIAEFQLPPNPAKLTDSRSADYVRKHGKYSWELDALKPADMERIVDDAILSNLDLDQYESIRDLEKIHISKLRDFANQIEDDEE